MEKHNMLGCAEQAMRCSICVGVFLIGLPIGARAQIYEQNQIIDQYLNPDIYGTDVQPGVTVTSREHHDYDPIGVQIGQFSILPKLAESIGYDDNVTGTRVSHGSLLLETTAGISAVDKMAEGTFSVQGNVSDFEYTSLSKQSYTPWNTSVLGTYKFGQDVLTVTATHSTMFQSPRDLSVPQLDNPIAYRIEDLNATYAISFARLQFEPAIDISYYNFDNGSVAGVPLLQSYRDRIVYYPSLTVKYELATRRDLVLVLRDADASYTTSVQGLPTQNFNDVALLGGLSYDVDAVIGFRLLGGYERREFSSRSYKPIQAPIVEGAVIWTPTELTTFNATVARYITDTSAEGTIGETETTLKLDIDHELFRNVIVSFKSLFTDAAYFGQQDQRLYKFGVGATWKLSRVISMAMDYQFTERQGGNVEAQSVLQPSVFDIGQSFKENLFRFKLGFAF